MLDVVYSLVHIGLETSLVVLKKIIRWQVSLHLVKNNHRTIKVNDSKTDQETVSLF